MYKRQGYGLIKNHCMIDGNKRIGTHAMLVFLDLNGIDFKYTQKELYETILDVAAGKDVYKRQASCHPADVVPAKRRFGRSAWSQAVL